MKNINKYPKYVFAILFIGFINAYSQVGINTSTPATILEITKSSDNSIPDGLLIPRLSTSDLVANAAAYSSIHNAVVVYVTDGNGVSGITSNINEKGFYYYNSASGKWEKLSSGSQSGVNYGDIKESQTESSDHSGWVKLDGRPVSSLTSSQQSNAAALGISGNLPDGNDAVLMKNGNPMLSVNGSYDRTISQSNLPALIYTGNTTDSTTGAHTHNYTAYSNFTALGSSNNNTPNRIYGGPGTDTNSVSHSHTVTSPSINGGVAQQDFNVMPRAYSVNMFIYLGE